MDQILSRLKHLVNIGGGNTMVIDLLPIFPKECLKSVVNGFKEPKNGWPYLMPGSPCQDGHGFSISGEPMGLLLR